MPEGLTPVEVRATQGDCAVDGAVVACRLGTVAPGTAVRITLVSDVDPGARGRRVVNVAEVAGDLPDGDPQDDRAEAATDIGAPVPAGARLSLTKTAETPAAEVGRPVRYRLVVRNDGDVARPARSPRSPRWRTPVRARGCAARWAACRRGPPRRCPCG
jgi:hypothetical protein